MRFGIAIAEGIALGIFVEWIKLNQMGKEIPTDPAYWIIQGVERSGTLGILTELNSMTEKTANFGVRPSINAIFGTSLPENSRYTLNNPTDVLFGPSVGLVSGLAKFLNAASNENIDISKQDMYWLMRLIPGGNLPFTAPVTNKVINQF
jgi:hypothetical protein